MASKAFRCRVVTPAARILDEDAVYASIPAWDGGIGIMVDRAALLTRLGAGELRVDFADSAAGKGGSRSYIIEGGFAQMVSNRLTILAEKAVPVESIAVSEAEAELRTAEGKTIAADAADRTAKVTALNAEKNFARLKIKAAKQAKGI